MDRKLEILFVGSRKEAVGIEAKRKKKKNKEKIRERRRITVKCEHDTFDKLKWKFDWLRLTSGGREAVLVFEGKKNQCFNVVLEKCDGLRSRLLLQTKPCFRI